LLSVAQIAALLRRRKTKNRKAIIKMERTAHKILTKGMETAKRTKMSKFLMALEKMAKRTRTRKE